MMGEDGNLTSNRKKMMLDTNIFDRLLEGRIKRVELDSCHLLVTPIQKNELDAMKASDSEAKRNRYLELIEIFRNISPVSVQAAFSLDIPGAGFDESDWHDGSVPVQDMFLRLEELDKNGPRKQKLDPQKRLVNQWSDVLIADAAIRNSADLWTWDRNLKTVFDEFSKFSDAQNITGEK